MRYNIINEYGAIIGQADNLADAVEIAISYEMETGIDAYPLDQDA
jgi:hypothetical protein